MCRFWVLNRFLSKIDEWSSVDHSVGGDGRSSGPSQVACEGNQLLKGVVLVQVIQIIRLLGDLGVLRVKVRIISFFNLSLVFVLLFLENLLRFGGLCALLLFFWALLGWCLLRWRLLPRHLHGLAGQWTRGHRVLPRRARRAKARVQVLAVSRDVVHGARAAFLVLLGHSIFFLVLGD